MDSLNKLKEMYRLMSKEERWDFLKYGLDIEGKSNLRRILYPDDDCSCPGFDVNLAEGAAGEIWVQTAVLMAEVKTDIKAGTTGNVAIEVGCSGHDSGITTTRARIWAHLLAGPKFTNPQTGEYEVAVLIATDRLRRIINGKHRCNGGDNGRAVNVIMPARELLASNDGIKPDNSQLLMAGFEQFNLI